MKKQLASGMLSVAQRPEHMPGLNNNVTQCKYTSITSLIQNKKDIFNRYYLPLPNIVINR